MACVADITERRQSQEALKESEEKYRTLVEMSPDGVVSLDVEGHIIDYNVGVCHLLGYGPEKMKEMDFKDLLGAATAEELPFLYEQALKE